MVLLEKILQYPSIYSLSQFLFAPGANFILNRRITHLLQSFPQKGQILDIGCGPKSWLWQSGFDPVGLDISFRYSKTFRINGTTAITGSSTDLPFSSGSFDGIWCIGVLHHLNDVDARKSIDEMLRIVSVGGYIIIMDAVLPNHPFLRPLASFIRYNDRGLFMRNEKHFANLLASELKWKRQRYTYSLTGLELLEYIHFCKYKIINS